jgi:glycosyltransferase involved in cell wall biosynthesis
MRIGIVYELVPAEYGGARTLQESLVDAFGQLETDHEIVLLNVARTAGDSAPQLRNPRVDVYARFAPQRGSPPAGIPSLTERVGRRLQREWQHSRVGRAMARGIPAKSTPPVDVPRSPLQQAVADLDLDVLWRPDAWLGPIEVPYCVTVWDIDFRLQPFFPEFVPNGMTWEAREAHHARALPRATRVFTGTEVGREQLIRFYGVNPANVVVNPYPVPRFVAEAGGAAAWEALARRGLREGFLFYPAAFWPHKNHVNLLLGMAALRDTHGLRPHLALTGADAGNVDHVRQTVARLGLQEQVHFLGFLSKEEVAEMYRHAAALVYPTFVGPDNLPPLEAFASGCPVVASDIPGAREQMGDAAVLFDPTQPEHIATCLHRVLSQPGLRAELTSRGETIARQRSCETYVRNVVRSLEAFEPYRRTWGSGYRLTL